MFDAHCHVASEEFIPRSFVEGVARNVHRALDAAGVPIPLSRVLDQHLTKLRDASCDELVREMAEAGVERAVLLLPDFTYALRDCRLTIAEMIAQHRKILERHPERFDVLFGVDPRWGGDAIELFEKTLAYPGFSGMKLYPPCGVSPSAKELYPFYEICSSRGLPVLLHVGPTSPALSFENTNAFALDTAARDFPSVNFILAHGAVSFVEECVMLCGFRPNVYLDISGFQALIKQPGGKDRLRLVFSRGINHKILFGTDWPVFRLQGSQRQWVNWLLASDGPLSTVSNRDREAILGKTALGLLPARTAPTAPP